MRVIVVGGGVMGLSAAAALMRCGHRVAVFEQGPIPNPLGSSVDQHRLIRHPYGPMLGYSRMIDPALAAWARTWAEIGQTLIRPTSTLVVARDDLSWARASLEEMARAGIPSHELDRPALAELCPWLCPDQIELAALIESGGVLLAQDIVRALAVHLVTRGATVHTNTPVVEIDTAQASVTLEDGSRQRADRVVIAAGPWVRDLVSSTSGRVKPSRQVVAYLAPPERYAAAWRRAPMLLDIHGRGGVYVVPPVAGTGLKVGDHSFSMRGHPDQRRTAESAEGAALMEACRGRLRALDDYQLLETKTCYYTVQREERFIIEPIDKALLMTGFSGHGFKFGALMGELAAGVLSERISAEDAKRIGAGDMADPAEITRLTSSCLG